VGIETDADKDLSLSDDDAEDVVGGKKKHQIKEGLRTAPGATESSKVTGTPSPLSPDPEESYMDTNP
jgi:hypothetical protein